MSSPSESSMSTSSESLDFLECCEFSRFGAEFTVASGTCTDSGNGDVGRGLCDASAPSPKLARVGVAASSIVRGSCVGAVLGLGVIGEVVDDVGLSSLIESAASSSVLTG